MANRSRQPRIAAPNNLPGSWSPRSVKWAWLEMVLPFFAAALLVVFHMPQYLPRDFVESAPSPLAWAVWAVLGAMGGVMIFSGLLVAFFLLYSPIYMAGKVPVLIGRGGWTDHREVRFYSACFAILCVLLALLLWDWRWCVSAFLLVTGFAPTFWRALV